MRGSVARIWAAVITGILSTFVIPAVAWAEESGVAEELRRRPRIGGFFGVIGALCCLVVVVGIVLAVLMIARRRGGGSNQNRY
ncbi:MAG TPA: hypothetical protein VF062_07515 [Candidatus Limnocylindrales bacterium]